ncbi:MAG: hypothetical protein ACREPG_05260 [Candidatus Binatia bacterium]
MNYGTGDDWLGRDGLLNFTQVNHILRKYRWQNLSLNVVATLLRVEHREVSRMPLTKEPNASLRDKLRQQPDSPVEANEDAPADSARPVIELADQTSGPEAEINRLKSRMITLSAEIGQIRSENFRLASDYQKLTTELREIKLVLAKVHAKELRASERPSSWSRSLKMLRGMFQNRPNSRKIGRSRNRVSILE